MTFTVTLRACSRVSLSCLKIIIIYDWDANSSNVVRVEYNSCVDNRRRLLGQFTYDLINILLDMLRRRTRILRSLIIMSSSRMFLLSVEFVGTRATFCSGNNVELWSTGRCFSRSCALILSTSCSAASALRKTSNVYGMSSPTDKIAGEIHGSMMSVSYKDSQWQHTHTSWYSRESRFITYCSFTDRIFLKIQLKSRRIRSWKSSYP